MNKTRKAINFDLDNDELKKVWLTIEVSRMNY